MTARSPDPDPATTPGLEPGGGVRPGDTPPESGQTSAVTHREPRRPRRTAVLWLLGIAVLALLVAGFLIGYAVIYAGG